ncbi:hypothetical protein ACVOMV_38070 [Mesorhizobium atlanticum]
MSTAAGFRCSRAPSPIRKASIWGRTSPTRGRNPPALDACDPLCEATPLPPESALPGWREAAAGYYKAMEKVGNAPLRICRARPWPDQETVFDKVSKAASPHCA